MIARIGAGCGVSGLLRDGSRRESPGMDSRRAVKRHTLWRSRAHE